MAKLFIPAKHADWIRVIGAREHNLKNISVSIPKGTLTVITGPSGSGKSSLALDILYTEGKRRYMESLSSYARQFLGIANKPQVERIEGLCPSIAIEQKTVGANPRSTVGTITEVYDYLRVLFARIGHVHCPHCFGAIKPESPESITDQLIKKYAGDTILLAAPLVHEKKGTFADQLKAFFERGFYRFIIDGKNYKFSSLDALSDLKLKKTHKHTIDLLIDQITVTAQEKSRLHEAVERALSVGNNQCKVISGSQEQLFSSDRMCLTCSVSIAELEPRSFSFNSPLGACKMCHGLGEVHEWPWAKGDSQSWKADYPDHFADKYARKSTCRSCFGKRLCPEALAVTVGGKTIVDLAGMALSDLHTFFAQVLLDETEQTIAQSLLEQIQQRIMFLVDVGLSYLSLNRSARTLSGGEGQRIRLATQIGSALSGVLYVLDEPSIGLHQRDNDRLIATLKALRDKGNTVVVVEHDIDTILQADYVIDMGPAAGVHGGMVTGYGTPESLAQQPESLTGTYLSGKRLIAVPQKVRIPQNFLTLHHAQRNNLKDLTVKIPLGVLCGVSGVSGSGKSTLIMQELVPALRQEFLGSMRRSKKSVEHSDLVGAESLENMVVIDQAPIGRTPRSNPATYLGIFDEIRKLFASLPESNARGYAVGRFSFNVFQGRCMPCKGDGIIKVTMHFLPEVTMVCKACKGTRYSAQTLEITYKNKNIAEVLNMTASEALDFFGAHRRIAKRLQLLCDVGLGYLKLGQPSTTLSGGEAQRIKLVNELAKRGSATLYILDEPTTGLHNADIEKLLLVLNRLIDKGNSMVVIEHNLDVLKTVDYLIDLGPEGGDGGGMIVAQGTPQKVAQSTHSYTGRHLKNLFS